MTVVASRVGPAPGPGRQDEATRFWGRIVLIDFLLGFVLIFDRYPLPGVGQPSGILIMVAAVAVGANRRPTRKVQGLWGIGLLYLLMVGWAVIISDVNGLSWRVRATKMLILLAFGLTLAVGRLKLTSLLTGYVVGVVVNALMFYAGLAPNNYPPYLTGFLNDKNVAGLVYAVLMVLGLSLYTRRRWRVLHVVAFAGFLFLTGSRTSMAAAFVALLWIWARNRFPVAMRLALGAAILWFLQLMESRFARIGVFRNREGTDWFRQQVDLATQAKIARSPWWGDGLGTAWVDVGSSDFMFFHNSYDALRIEGGWVMVAIMLYLVAFKGMGLLSTKQVPKDLAIIEGAVLILLVTASRLGEVFFTTPALLVLGIAWGLRYGNPADGTSTSSAPQQVVDLASEPAGEV